MSQWVYVPFHTRYVVCHCPLSKEVELLDDAAEVGLGLVRNVECVGNHPVGIRGGGEIAALDVAYGGRGDKMLVVILADPGVEDGSVVEVLNLEKVEEDEIDA